MKLKVIVNPHPFTSELWLLIQGNFDVNVVIRLIDSSGNLIKIVSGTLKKGDNNISITDLQSYPPGSYQLEIRLLNGDLLESLGLVKS
jgi:hypothetical protein